MAFHLRHWWIFPSFLLTLGLLLSACNPLESKAKAGLQVETGSLPATLFLDDQYLEKTPFINKEIKPGKYTLKIQPEDSTLSTYETEINLRKGLLTVVTWVPGPRPETSGGVIYEMEKTPENKTSELTIITIPDAGIVKVGDRDKEFAPLTLNPIDSGEKEYEVSLPSYDTQQHAVNLLPGYRTTITVKLAKSAYNPSVVASPSGSPTSLTEQVVSASPSQTPNVTTKPLVSPIVTPAPSPLSAAITPRVIGTKVTIKATNFFQNNQEVLRVRRTAGAGETLGYAPVGGEYQYTGQTQAGWYQITFESQLGWVSAQYATLTQ